MDFRSIFMTDRRTNFFAWFGFLSQEVIPYHLSTSPILSEGTVLMEAQLKRNSIDRIRNLDNSVSSQVPPQAHGSQPGNETSPVCSSVKKRRKKRRKSTHKIDSLKREDIGDTSEDEDMFPIEISSEEEKEPLDNSRYHSGMEMYNGNLMQG